MTNLFSFDEEALSADFRSGSAIADDSDDFNPRELTESVLGRSPQRRRQSNLHPLGAHSFRRRSSVYGRMSISSSVKSSEIKIPAGYKNEEEGNANVRLEDFEPLTVLGQGAYGKVYLVKHKVTNKLFAQKQVRKPAINMSEETEIKKHIDRTLSERQILTNITHHPNIVKLFYALHDQEKFYLILEYIPGGELFHHLSSNGKNVFKEDDVAFYAAQMALGMRHLHQLGIVYRDLKPENCLLNTSGHLVLTDFGLSKDIDPNDKCTSIIGTPEYMAPEVLKGESYDYAVDWWSLGCVIYDMMSGKPPFTGNSHKNIQDKIVKNKLNIPFYFSMDARDLVNKLLNKNPSKRFAVDEKWSQFQQHRFFRKIDWKALELQTATPPIQPVITDPILAENFLSEFTSMKISGMGSSSLVATTSIDIAALDPADSAATFTGFSYAASSSFVERWGMTLPDIEP